jgi:hypothetical protein
MLTQALFALMLASPVTVYVGPLPSGDGFVETDKDTGDSIKDIRRELKREKTVRVVDEERGADVSLYVVQRGTHYIPGGSTIATRAGNSTYVASASYTAYHLETVLRAGDYERVFSAEGIWTWSSLAKRIAKDVSVWTAANRERVASR